MPDSGSTARLVRQHVAVDASVLARDVELRAREVMPPPVGDAHHARHDRVGHLDRHLDLTRRERARAVVPSARSNVLAVSG